MIIIDNTKPKTSFKEFCKLNNLQFRFEDASENEVSCISLNHFYNDYKVGKEFVMKIRGYFRARDLTKLNALRKVCAAMSGKVYYRYDEVTYKKIFGFLWKKEVLGEVHVFPYFDFDIESI